MLMGVFRNGEVDRPSGQEV